MTHTTPDHLTAIRERLAELVAESSDGAIPAARALAATTPLSDLGLSSLSRMRLVDAVEDEYDVEIDLDGAGWDLVDDLTALATHLATPR
ncbi:phosphopantetheine-binding protein [Actinacidiphila epipremni]|jgi:acyl carrier protein|uniref:Acyl carrier protein n=1 Tax=Actinacidiphila epipremni TaxID=2053013 RepID=A0ABX0ZIR2_9ACTN|nr:phosphopantetheine-binding protein [Actinacidiphila epipremni]NJP42656.1 acyl carrier protein [Actinacidiphila epipremni]